MAPGNRSHLGPASDGGKLRELLPLQRGVSLIELMVAIALGLVVLAALSALFLNTSANRREIDRAAGVLENGRYALSVLKADLAMAGYYGTLSASWGTNDAVACSDQLSHWADSLSYHVRGSNQDDTSLDACFAGTALPARKPGTDALVVQRASTCIAGPVAESGCEGMAAANEIAYLQVSECGDEYTELVNLSTPPFRLARGTSASQFAVLKKRKAGATSCAADGTAPIRRFYKSLYYVDTSNNLIRADMLASLVAGIPAYAWTVQAENIESLQFQYAFDTNADGSAEVFGAAPPTGSSWADAMGVRIWLLARASSATPGYANDKAIVMDDYSATPTDSFRRHVFSSYVGFVNPAGKRFK